MRLYICHEAIYGCGLRGEIGVGGRGFPGRLADRVCKQDHVACPLVGEKKRNKNVEANIWAKICEK